jgi:hypothetical protein
LFVSDEGELDARPDIAREPTMELCWRQKSNVDSIDEQYLVARSETGVLGGEARGGLSNEEPATFRLAEAGANRSMSRAAGCGGREDAGNQREKSGSADTDGGAAAV